MHSKIPGDMDGILSRYLIKERIKAVCPYLQDKQRILDIGCGVFRWQNLLPSGAEYTGIDFNKAIIEYNQKHFQHRFFTINAETDSLSVLGGDFNLIMMLAVIEHFNKPEIVLTKLRPTLNIKGVIVLTTPHPSGSFLLNFGAKFGIFARDKCQHHNLVDYKKINKLASIAGFKIIKYQRFLYGFNQLAILGISINENNIQK